MPLVPLVILLTLGLTDMVDAAELKSITFGPIKTLSIPADWKASMVEKKSVLPPHRPYKIYTVSPKVTLGSSVEITNGARDERPEELAVYGRLTSELPPSEDSRPISGEELKSLSYFLARIGANQFQNPSTTPGFRSECVISSAKVVRINGKKAMRFEGDFHGPDTLFSWVLFYNPVDKQTYEIFMRSTSAESRSKNMPAFDQMLNSIEWK